MSTVAELEGWMNSSENEHLEFKEARSSFHFEELVKYCVALANEGGGKMVLGVTDARPRRVVGSQAFADLENTKSNIFERLHMRIDAEELAHQDGRVVVFHAPSHPLGIPIQYQGAYWMRAGGSIVPMTPDCLRKIFDESGPDYSAEICEGATINDLDEVGIKIFRDRWHRKSGNLSLLILSDDQLLRDAELIVDGGITYAALVLLGKHEALGRLLGQAEVIFEYRSTDASGPANKREEFRQGAFLFFDSIWNLIDLRNDKQHFQDGLYIWDIPTFNEVATREAILNAISHRDYRMAGSVYVRQYSRKLVIESPGGFPSGITEDNILDTQAPRNRRIAEVLSKCGLVERSGQGINRMVEESIKEGKARPDFSGTDSHNVRVTFHCEIQDPQFLRFLEKVGQQTLASFSTHDFLLLDLVHRGGQHIPPHYRSRLQNLIDQKIIEVVGRGKGTQYLLSRQFYKFIGKSGVYTRRRGLDRDTNKELLLKHIRENQKKGSQLRDLVQVLPSLTVHQVRTLLRELKDENRIRISGRGRGGRWYADGTELPSIRPHNGEKPN